MTKGGSILRAIWVILLLKNFLFNQLPLVELRTTQLNSSAAFTIAPTGFDA